MLRCEAYDHCRLHPSTKDDGAALIERRHAAAFLPKSIPIITIVMARSSSIHALAF